MFNIEVFIFKISNWVFLQVYINCFEQKNFDCFEFVVFWPGVGGGFLGGGGGFDLWRAKKHVEVWGKVQCHQPLPLVVQTWGPGWPIELYLPDLMGGCSLHCHPCSPALSSWGPLPGTLSSTPNTPWCLSPSPFPNRSARFTAQNIKQKHVDLEAILEPFHRGKWDRERGRGLSASHSDRVSNLD